jgi:hypothetical protein
VGSTFLVKNFTVFFSFERNRYWPIAKYLMGDDEKRTIVKLRLSHILGIVIIPEVYLYTKVLNNIGCGV